MTVIAQAVSLSKDFLDDYFRAVYLKNFLADVVDEDLETPNELTPIEEEITLCLDGVLDARFKVDFFLMGSQSEIINYYDELVYHETNGSFLRLLSNMVNHLIVNFSSEANLEKLIDELSTILSLNSNIDENYTTMASNLVEVLTKEDWTILLSNNPWLIAVNVIKFISACSVLAYSQPEVMLTIGAENETRNNG